MPLMPQGVQAAAKFTQEQQRMLIATYALARADSLRLYAENCRLMQDIQANFCTLPLLAYADSGCCTTLSRCFAACKMRLLARVLSGGAGQQSITWQG